MSADQSTWGIQNAPTYQYDDAGNYLNFSMANRPQGFAGSGYGAPNSPAYQAYSPRDLLERSRTYGGNSSFAPPMGFQFGNPLMNMGMDMAARALLGNEGYSRMAPLSSVNMPAMDYMRSRERSLFARNALYSDQEGKAALFPEDDFKKAFPGISDMRIAAQLYDQVLPGGSRIAAFNSAYGRLGTTFGGSIQDQGRAALGFFKQMDQQFSGDGLGNHWDRMASYGMDRAEVVDAMDSGLRSGLGGVSRESFRNAAASGQAGGMLQKNTEMFAAAREIFGKDKSMDELAKAMTSIVDGASSLSPEKMTSVLTKIQSTARAVNISTQALAEYGTMFDQISKSQGLGGGGVNTAAFLQSVQSSDTVTELGRQSHDVYLADAGQNRRSADNASMSVRGSFAYRNLSSFGAIMANMSDSQRASVSFSGSKITGTGMVDAIRKAYSSGDAAEIDRLSRMVTTQLNDNGLISSNAVLQGAQNNSKRTQTLAADFLGTPDALAIQGSNIRNEVLDMMSTDLSGGSALNAGFGGKKGLTAFAKAMGNDPAAMASQARVLETMQQYAKMPGGDSRFATKSLKELEDLAGQFSETFNRTTEGVGLLGRTGAANAEEIRAGLAGASDAAIQKNEEAAAQGRRDDSETEYMRGIAGDVLGGASDRIKNGLVGIYQDFQKKDFKTPEERKAAMIKKAADAFGGGAQMEALIQARDGDMGAREEAIRAGDDAYAATKGDEKTKVAARAKAVEAITKAKRRELNEGSKELQTKIDAEIIESAKKESATEAKVLKLVDEFGATKQALGGDPGNQAAVIMIIEAIKGVAAAIAGIPGLKTKP